MTITIGHLPQLSRFEIVREIGRGGMGVVYDAIDRQSGAHVALKMLRRLDGQRLYRFKKEFRALREVHHPNLVSLGELFEEDGSWFFTMDLLKGMDLLAYCTNAEAKLDIALQSTLDVDASPEQVSAALARSDLSHQFNESRLRQTLPQLVRAIGAIHDADKIHRDIKPSNIFVTETGRVVVLDFGIIVERQSAEQEKDPFVAGTPFYMAPEQASGHPVTPAVDWYALGVTLHTILTGAIGHDTDSPMQILRERQRELAALPSRMEDGIPEDLGRLCMDLLAHDPEMRPSRDEILERLKQQQEPQSNKAPEFFVGRAAELSKLQTSRDDVGDARPQIVLISGESGVGKTTLMNRFSASLEGPFLSLHGKCREHESVPYNAFDGIIDMLTRVLEQHQPSLASLAPQHVSNLKRAFPVLSRIESIREAPEPTWETEDHVEQRNQIFAGLRHIFSSLCRAACTVLCIDDIQWADDDSLTLLNALLCPPDAPPLLVLATIRPKAVGPIARQLPEPPTILSLSPLSKSNTRQLALQAATRPLKEHELERIVIETAGHPLFILELARDITQSTEMAPIVLEDALRKRVSSLPRDARVITEVACVSPAPLPSRLVCEAASVSLQHAPRTVASLLNNRFIRLAGGRGSDKIEPYHDRIRSSVLSSLEERTRTLHHASLANVLINTRLGRETPEVVVHHLEKAGRLEDAASYAEAGAERYMEGLAFDRAAKLYAQVLRMRGSDGCSHQLLLSCAQAHARAGRVREAAPMCERAARCAPPEVKRIALRDTASYHLIAGEVDKGTATIRVTLKHYDIWFPESEAVLLLYLFWLQLLLWFRGLPPDPGPVSSKEGYEAEGFDTICVFGSSYILIDNLRSRLLYLMAMKRVQGADRRAWARLMILESGSMASRGGMRLIQKAKVLNAQLAIVVEQAGDPYLKRLHKAIRGVIEFFSSSFSDAEETLEAAEREYVSAAHFDWAELNLVRFAQTLNMMYRGKLKVLRQLLSQSLNDASQRGDVFTERAFTYRYPIAWAADGRVEEWRTRCQEMAKNDPTQSHATLLDFYRIAGMAEGALAQQADAGRMVMSRLNFYHRMLMLRGINADEATSLIGRLLLSRWKESQASRVMGLASVLERAGTGFARTQASLLRAGCANRKGNTPMATEHLKEAIVTARECGMELTSHVAMLRLAALHPGDYCSGADEADDWMVCQDIQDKAAIMRVIAPGFE